MTLKEKKDVLSDFCNSQYECLNCTIASWCNSITCWDELSEEIVDEGLQLAGISIEEPPEEPVETEVHDVVNHPKHYTNGAMECIDEMILLFGKEVVKHFCVCNAWKYRYRANHKNGDEDLKKADWYIAKFKELS